MISTARRVTLPTQSREWTDKQGPRERYKLEDIVSQMPEGSEAEEADWGCPVGKEVW